MSDGFVRQNTADQDKKLDAERLQVGGLEVFRLRSAPGPMAVRLDQVDANTLYIGEALPGAATADYVWRVKELLTVGGASFLLYANGTADFVHSWDGRAGLVYS